MKTDITQFIGSTKKTFEEGIMIRFNKLIEGKSKREIRKIEIALLKPKPIPIYKGKKPTMMSNIKRKSIIIYFPNEEIIRRLSNFIKINTYVENNSYDVAIFIELLRLLENKTIKWDKKKNHFIFNLRTIKRREK